MQQELFEKFDKQQLLYDLFQAYYDARKNKRNTINALKFEKYFEANLFCLFNEIIENKYEPKPSICFIVEKPVKREIFAADFRDRVIHHLIFNYINPVFEPTFINDSYSCRKGKGTHYGIQRIEKFIRSCSQNYTKDCYILKLDIKGYFMGINKPLLYKKLTDFLYQQKSKLTFDLPTVLYLLEKTIFNDPKVECNVKGQKADWEGLPKTKSLFYARKYCGLPIGNLTSQLFANIYLNDFDHHVKQVYKIKYYGRYVDDFILIHPDKNYLNSLIPILSNFLLSNLKLVLHPAKIYLQHYSIGVKFLGTIIKPHRIYIANRTNGNFFQAIEKQNKIIRDHKPDKVEMNNFLSCMNSYLGIMKHYKTYKIRKRLIKNRLSGYWWNLVNLKNGYQKFVLKKPISYYTFPKNNDVNPKSCDMNILIGDMTSKDRDKNPKNNDMNPKSRDMTFIIDDITPNNSNKNPKNNNVNPKSRDMNILIGDITPNDSNKNPKNNDVNSKSCDMNILIGDITPNDSNKNPKNNDMNPKLRNMSSFINDVNPNENDKNSTNNTILYYVFTITQQQIQLLNLTTLACASNTNGLAHFAFPSMPSR